MEEIRSVKVGLEIHQQLATKHKLFCPCTPIEVDEHEYSFIRMLRPSRSELGELDPAMLFEFRKGKMIKYLASSKSSCLVEMDEEPPHEINREALEIALMIAKAVNAEIVDEIHVMRKMVIDGSNTSGFQRTMLVAIGGYIDDVKIQTISLEEDSARLIEENEGIKTYVLDRLGIPLIELSLEPVSKSIDEIVQLALKVGRLLRATKRVARGLGTIRQDVNISINGGNIVEIKGVQRLDQLKKVIEYEIKRQHSLILIANELKKRVSKIEYLTKDVTDIFKGSKSKIISNVLERGGSIYAIKVCGIAGMLGLEPYPGIRIGKELGELVRFYGLGGIFHSDELPAYGIEEIDLVNVREKLEAKKEDAIILLGGKKENLEYAIEAIIKRLEDALKGVPAETRAATPDGRTIYSRPRPGSARLYPETDIMPVVITNQMISTITIPKRWEEYIDDIVNRYNINKVLAEKIFDSEYLNLFELIVRECKNIQPSFIASTLTESLTSLERRGYNVSTIKDESFIKIFKMIDEGRIAKESIVPILELMSSKNVGVYEAIKALSLESLSEQEIENIIDKIIMDNLTIIKEKGENSFGMLMGKAMDRLRGKVDGKKVSILIRSKLTKIISSTS